MKAYSMDLRERVLADCDEGLKTWAVATKCRVSESWVRRLLQRRRERAEAAPRKGSGRRPKWFAYAETLFSERYFLTANRPPFSPAPSDANCTSKIRPSREPAGQGRKKHHEPSGISVSIDLPVTRATNMPGFIAARDVVNPIINLAAECIQSRFAGSGDRACRDQAIGCKRGKATLALCL
jgi:hypothetical protein